MVEDDEPSARLLVLLLEARGHVVRTAIDGPSMFATLAQCRPAVILLDLLLPGTDGWALARMLKEAPSTRSIPIIAVTADATRGNEARARSAGCDEYVTKPIDIATFPELVARVLAERQGTRQV